MQEISFDHTTFWFQFHGLPPTFLHKDSARNIGNLVGVVEEISINNKTVVAQHFLRVRIDIPVANPIPAGFFQNRGNGKEVWIQFKIERLPDFCYTCGLLNHVTGRCTFSTPAMITTGAGLQAKLYGPWLRAENAGTILFVNPPEQSTKRKGSTKILEIFNAVDTISKDCSFEDTLVPYTEKGKQKRWDFEKDDSKDRFENMLTMCPELQTLNFTLKRLPSRYEFDLEEAILDKIRREKMSLEQIAS